MIQLNSKFINGFNEVTFKLSKIIRPSSTPVTIDAKLSSISIISAACFDTSEPVMPIAIPISAFFKAGESFTPSPANRHKKLNVNKICHHKEKKC